MTALPSIKLTAMPWGVISAGGGDHHPHPCGLGLNVKTYEVAGILFENLPPCFIANYMYQKNADLQKPHFKRQLKSPEN